MQEIDAVNAAALSENCVRWPMVLFTEEKDTVQIHDRKLDALEDLIEGEQQAPSGNLLV